jgi:hypothetical protein
MKPVVSSLVLATALAMADAAMAQQPPSDAEYCRTLARAYLSQNPVQSSPNVADATLLDSCAGDAQGTTATLKQKLAAHGIDLPKPTMAGAGQ